MHAYLIIGANQLQRDAKIQEKLIELKVGPLDQVIIEEGEKSIGIAEVRRFAQRLATKPIQSNYVVGIVSHAHLLTTIAQQALLKTIEEPPAHAILLLAIHNEQTLLETILSRCQIIRLGNVNEDANPYQLVLEKLETSSLGNRIALLGTVPKEEQDMFIKHALYYFRKKVRNTAQKKYIHIVKKLLEATNYRNNNVNALHLLEVAFSVL